MEMHCCCALETHPITRLWFHFFIMTTYKIEMQFCCFVFCHNTNWKYISTLCVAIIQNGNEFSFSR